MCGSLLLTVVFFSTLMGHPAPGQHGGTHTGFMLACLGAWVFTGVVLLVEALRSQFRRPRR